MKSIIYVAASLLGLACASPAPTAAANIVSAAKTSSTSTSTSMPSPSPYSFQPLFHLRVERASNRSYEGLWMTTDISLAQYVIFTRNASAAATWYSWYFAAQRPKPSWTLADTSNNYLIGVSNGDRTGLPFSASAFGKSIESWVPPLGLPDGFVYDFRLDPISHRVFFNQTEAGEMDQTRTQICPSDFDPPNRFIVTHEEQSACVAVELKWVFAGVHLPKP